jgi:AcrR family transcriptional regulator
MGLLYHIGNNKSIKEYGTIVDMEVPYLHTGRTNQKVRTKDALVAAARRLLAEGVTPTLEEAAAEASIGRTTAYRYFPNSRALLAATYPEIEMGSLLGADPPEDPLARFEIMAESLTRQLLEHEPELRAQLRLALEGESAGGESVSLRRGRRIRWIEDALSPLGKRMPERELRRLIYGIGATLGIEALVWLTDVGELSREEAVEVMRSNARTLLRSALERLTRQL